MVQEEQLQILAALQAHVETQMKMLDCYSECYYASLSLHDAHILSMNNDLAASERAVDRVE
jgi:hypothetical protein